MGMPLGIPIFFIGRNEKNGMKHKLGILFFIENSYKVVLRIGILVSDLCRRKITRSRCWCWKFYGARDVSRTLFGNDLYYSILNRLF